MAVRKMCRGRGCRSSPRCEHEWWLDATYKGRRYRMVANDFAIPRGAERKVTTKQEAKHWDAAFALEVQAGRDPRVPPGSTPTPMEEMTIRQYIDHYLEKYVDLEPMKDREGKRSKCRVLQRLIGDMPAKELETARPAEAVKAAYTSNPVATMNRYLSELRFITNWALGRGDVATTPFHRRGVRIKTSGETQRDRRVPEEEEHRLLDACDLLDQRTMGASRLNWSLVEEIRQRAAKGEQQKSLAQEFGLSSGYVSQVVNGAVWKERTTTSGLGQVMKYRIVGAIETCCRRGEMQKIQNKDVDWRNGWIKIRKENTKNGVARSIPFRGNQRLTSILKRRRFLGAEAYVFGDEDGGYVKSFRKAWESVVLLANEAEPERASRRGALSKESRRRFKGVDLHWHDFRHEGLSRYGEGGMTLSELRVLAGHTNPKTTQRYEHVDLRRLSDAMEASRKQRQKRLSKRSAR
jgi:integrase